MKEVAAESYTTSLGALRILFALIRLDCWLKFKFRAVEGHFQFCLSVLLDPTRNSAVSVPLQTRLISLIA